MSVYVVMHTWNELGLDQPMRFALRSLGEPKYVKILNAGHHFLNSCTRLPPTVSKNGQTVPHRRVARVPAS